MIKYCENSDVCRRKVLFSDFDSMYTIQKTKDVCVAMFVASVVFVETVKVKSCLQNVNFHA